jgi:hypothetical protein
VTNVPRSVRTTQMYGHRSTGFWVVVNCPNGVTPPARLYYGPFGMDALGTPAEALQEVNDWLGTRGVYKPLRAIGRIIGKSSRQVDRYLSGEVEPQPGPGWEGVVQVVMALSWDDKWKIWSRLTRPPRTQSLGAPLQARGVDG